MCSCGRCTLVTVGAYTGGGAWTARVNDLHQKLELEWPDPLMMTKLVTGGRQNSREFVSQFLVEYSHDGRAWYAVRDGHGIQKVSCMPLPRVELVVTCGSGYCSIGPIGVGLKCTTSLLCKSIDCQVGHDQFRPSGGFLHACLAFSVSACDLFCGM